ncbi:unnamed protein product, partial [Laminaria digitata]
MYDSCAANLKAIREVVLEHYFQTAHGIQCLSHMFNNTGGRIKTKMANRVIMGLRALLSQSFANRAFGKETVGKSWKSVNAVRCGASHDCNQDVMKNLVEMRLFLKELKTADLSTNVAAQELLELLDDPIDGLLAKLQLAVLCDVGGVIAHATYALESNSPMIEKTWDIVQTVTTLTQPVLPNSDAVIHDATKHLHGPELELRKAELRRICLACNEGLREYGFERFGGHVTAKFSNQLLLSKAARAIKPGFVAMYADAATMLEDMPSLLAFNFVTPAILDGLTLELITYFPIARNLPSYSISTRDFWLSHKEQLPLWFDLVRKLWLFQPSSAMMERVFSVVNNVFGAQQTTILNDLFELTVMLRHNR